MACVRYSPPDECSTVSVGNGILIIIHLTVAIVSMGRCNSIKMGWYSWRETKMKTTTTNEDERGEQDQFFPTPMPIVKHLNRSKCKRFVFHFLRHFYLCNSISSNSIAVVYIHFLGKPYGAHVYVGPFPISFH